MLIFSSEYMIMESRISLMPDTFRSSGRMGEGEALRFEKNGSKAVTEKPRAFPSSSKIRRILASLSDQNSFQAFWLACWVFIDGTIDANLMILPSPAFCFR